MNIKEMLAPVGSKCRPGQRLKGFVGVTIHNTGNTSQGANALSHGRYLQGGGKNTQASWHYCVDENCITRSIPENEVAWHAGDGAGSGNYKTVAIEICMNSDGNIKRATDNATELTADILRRHGMKQAEGYVYQHNHWSGKNCPQKIREGAPYNWQAFLNKVNQILEEEEMTEEQVKAIVKKVLAESKDQPSSWASADWAGATKLGITDGSKPQAYITREQVATMIMRAVKAIVKAIKG